MNAPEGLAVSPDGASSTRPPSQSGAIDTLMRDGIGRAHAEAAPAGLRDHRRGADCTPGRALSGASSVAVSPDGRNLYATAFSSDAVGVFKRVTRGS